jgi:hypothetical protein
MAVRREPDGILKRVDWMDREAHRAFTSSLRRIAVAFGCPD